MKLYKINETLENSYYQMPQELFYNENYKYLSIEAKVIYSFLLNRMGLSRINNWTNDEGAIYLIYTRKEIQRKLNLSDKPVTRAFKELRESNLINEEKQVFGKPNLIYIGKIEHEIIQVEEIEKNTSIETENVQLENRKKNDSYQVENQIHNTEELRTNKKNIINQEYYKNDVSQSEIDKSNLEKIKQNCELYLFKPSQRNIIENVLDIMFYSEKLKIGQAVLPMENVISRMQLLNASIIFYAFDKLNYLEPDTQINNSTNFMISCLYNAITEYYSDSDLQYRIDYGSG